jgi:methylated-DNA-[protein]-cysteine S-methyltransferase
MNGIGYCASPIGDLEITSVDHKITGVRFLTSIRSEVNLTPAVEQCIFELEEYFVNGRKFFNVDLQISGSVFQNKVWNELLAIPYGKTMSYLELALRIGDINSVRAVGLANAENPIAILVPCHRVIGKDGDLVGYGGGLDKKIWLLEHEGAFAEQLKLFR